MVLGSVVCCLADQDLGPINVIQVHSDWHLGLRAAISEHFKSARFVGDWAHVVGATKRAPLSASCPEGVQINRWRAGMFSNMRQELNDVDLLEELERYIHAARFLPLGAFSLYMMELLAWLTGKGELRVSALLQNTYLIRAVTC